MTVLTAANWPLIGQLCWLLGKVMNFIYTCLDKALPTDTGLVGLSIVIYTIIVYMLMLPITIKQQKTSRLTSVMNPEIQAIQKKYRGKRDSASAAKQQEEIQQVYDKYGTSMMSGCLPMAIQMPLLFALYPVIYNIKNYVPAIASAPASVNRFLSIPDLTLAPKDIFKMRASFDIPTGLIILTVILLPVLSAITQYLSIQLSMSISGQNNTDKDDPMAASMKSMNVTMPVFSLFMVYTLASGIGLYWVVSAVIRCIQQIFINKHLQKMSVEELVEKNAEAAKRKAEKRIKKNERINQMAQQNTKKVSKISNAEREEKIARARRNADNAKPGSLTAKANMVKKYNENK